MSERKEELLYAAIKGFMGIKIVRVEEVGDKEVLFYMPQDMYERYKRALKSEKPSIEAYCKEKFPPSSR